MRSKGPGVCPYCGAQVNQHIAAAAQPLGYGARSAVPYEPHWHFISQARLWLLPLLLVICVVGSAAVTRWWITRSVPAWSAQVVVETIVPVAKMATAEATVQETLAYSDAMWGSVRIPKLLGRKFWVSERAKLAVGFDLTDWDATHNVTVDDQKRMVTVTVPKPELLYVNTEPTSLMVMGEAGLFRDGDLTKEETAEVLQRVDQAFRVSDRLGELGRQARIQFENILTQAVKPYGLRINVVYQ